MPELNFVFNVVHDIFILKGKNWKDTVIYGIFTSQWSVFLFIYILLYLYIRDEKNTNWLRRVYIISSLLCSSLFCIHHPADLSGVMLACQQFVHTT